MRPLWGLAPLVSLAFAAVALRSLNLAANGDPALERALGRVLVAAVALGVLWETARVVRFRRFMPLAFFTVGLAVAYLFLTQAVRRVAPGAEEGARLVFGEAFGPVTTWPAAAFASDTLAGSLTLGRVLFAVATALPVAATWLLLSDGWRARRVAAAAAPAPALLASTACPACLPPLAAVLGMAVGGAAAPLAGALANPASPVAAAADFAGPLLALAGLLAVSPWAPRRAPGPGRGPVAAFAVLPVLALFDFPRGASTLQHTNYVIFWIAVVASATLIFLTLAPLVYFAVRYRRWEWLTPPAPTLTPVQERVLKVGIVLVPALFIFGVGALSHGVLQDLEREPPPGRMHVEVEGLRFSWFFTYENGTTSVDEVRVPVNEVVWLNVTSRDVVHSFFVPDLGVKIDAVPGGTTRFWFQATAPGEYRLSCAEFCGVGHADMQGRVIVEPEP